MRQRLWASSCTQRTPAGLLMPSTTGMPGMAELILGAMQQAPQPLRHWIFMGVDVFKKVLGGDRAG